jgi:DNA-binding SARP family transcriptional activator
MTIHLRTLGHIHLRDDAGVELRSLLTQPKRLALLIYLASNGADGRMCRRDSLLAMFWPDSDAERARNSLRQAVHFIKQATGSDVVVTRGADELSLAPGAVSMDAAMLDELAQAGRHEEVVAMYAGDFLNGFFVRGAPDFEQWVSGERSRLRTRVADSAWLATEQCLAKGDAHGARAMGARALALSSNNETAVRRFITLLAESGDRAAALAVYQDFAGQMAKEYGVAPSPETRALVERLEVAGTAQQAEPLTVVAPFTEVATSAAASSRGPSWRRTWLITAAAALIIAGVVSALRPVFGNPDNGSGLISARLRLMLATDASTRAAGLREVAALDSLCSTHFTSQTAFAPRALYQLDVARALEADGRLADAEQRLHAVPEDFGFNVAYLAEVQRRRAALLDRLKRPAEAEVARRAMRSMLQ